uniref:Uncharacterized protein n=1 Tax=Brugia malayi TaxID=6279 RepID=A8PIZ6_BRUMA
MRLPEQIAIYKNIKASAHKDDTRWPYVGMATMAEDGSDAYFKIILKFTKLEKDDPMTTTWAVIILG